MPTFPIQNPKQFAWDLLEYLKQAYHYMMCMKNSSQTIPYSGGETMSSEGAGGDGILKPTLAPNHPQLKLQHQQKTGSTFDEVLNAYNRSKSRKKLETEALLEQQRIQSQYKYDFAKDTSVEQHIIMVLKALIAVIKANHDVEIQCIGNFEMIFGFLANNLFSDVSMGGLSLCRIDFQQTKPFLILEYHCQNSGLGSCCLSVEKQRMYYGNCSL